MRTRLIALAATLSILSLAASSMAVAGTTSGGGGSAGGGGGHGGAAGAAGGHGGGGWGGGHAGGGMSGGHYGGGSHFSGGGSRGGSYGGGYAAHDSYMAHGGFVAHGTSGYRIIGYQSSSSAHISTAPHGGPGARITLALGPRTGSAATAVRLGAASHADHMHPRPGHPGHSGKPKHPYSVRVSHAVYTEQYASRPPLFCDDFEPWDRGVPQPGCPNPIKAKVGAKAASAR